MTIVAAWQDWTVKGEPRIVCVADSRISQTNSFKRISNTATKIFIIPVIVRNISAYTLGADPDRDTVHRTQVGIAYEGDPLLAFEVVGVLQKTLSHLTWDAAQASHVDVPPPPRLEDIANHIHTVVKAISVQFDPLGDFRTSFLIFGFCMNSHKPLAFTIRYNAPPQPKGNEERSIGVVDSIELVDMDRAIFVLGENGAMQVNSSVSEAKEKARRRITLLSNKRKREKNVEKWFDLELDITRERKLISDACFDALDKIVSEGRKTIGGVLQVVEATQDGIRHLLTGNGSVMGLEDVWKVGDDYQVVVIRERL
ncbi:hypothetical protein VH569_03225 [Azospirillum sp. 11R-A]|uniref:hypothetical protein n=1 Tax=Azospirillum sp. 11R-A TaxID=3111634 RepID=UPI003C19AA4B